MNMPVYKLGGASAEAATRLLLAQMQVEATQPPIQYPISMADVHTLVQIFYAQVNNLARKELMPLLESLGLDSPIIAVSCTEGAHPRAYETYPQIYTDGGDTPAFFMYPPVSYKGTHFVPADSKRLTEKESEAANCRLFAGGWSDPISVLPVKPQGVALPADFDPASSTYDIYGKGHAVPNIFLPAGASRTALDTYAYEKTRFDTHMHELTEALKAAVLKQAEISLGEDDIQGDGMYVNLSYSLTNTPNIEISLRRDGKSQGSLMMAGQPLPMPSSADYETKAAESPGSFIITPASAPTTAEGQRIKALYDSIPPMPSLNDAHALGVPANAAVYAHRFGGIDFLYYTASENAPAPQDARPVSFALYSWIRHDDEDRRRGITPPPMPAALQAEWTKLGFQTHHTATEKPAFSPA